jgi:hydrogenase-4 component H
VKWPKLRELAEAITSVVKGPYTHPFPAKPTPVPKTIRGVPIYHELDCVGCGACAEVCVARAIEERDVTLEDGRQVRRLILHYDNCVFCGECVRCCTTGKGITYSEEYELSGLDREVMVHTVDKELVECELCGSAIAPRDHLRWIYRRLGAHAYSNVTVSLIAQEDLGLRDKAPDDQRPLNRADLQRVLCPSCRRGVTLLDEWGPVS